MRKMATYDYSLKFILLGKSPSGKSWLRQRFIAGKAADSKILDGAATIGCDSGWKDISIGDKAVRLKIWDMAGPYRFQDIRASYIRGGDVVFICLPYSPRDYDCENYVLSWKKEVESNVNKSDHFPIIFLVGTAADRALVFSQKEGDVLAKNVG
jgi:GTPase SAR1 family protein